MIQDKVIAILRGPKSKRKSSSGSLTASIHVLKGGLCTVQVGSRLLAEDVTFGEAHRIVHEKQTALLAKGIRLKVETWERK